ncbi:hypothetical protein [Providencia stuartii]|uniref:hypothetical protein n=1 Tax=Providencia stuartii TaxID=588 RepID=UPI0024AC6799|nr:hypothetical protein [Providencia stuartii]MCX3072618.1 hypothetical protein [Providencia stuartii]
MNIKISLLGCAFLFTSIADAETLTIPKVSSEWISSGKADSTMTEVLFYQKDKPTINKNGTASISFMSVGVVGVRWPLKTTILSDKIYHVNNGKYFNKTISNWHVNCNTMQGFRLSIEYYLDDDLVDKVVTSVGQIEAYNSKRGYPAGTLPWYPIEPRSFEYLATKYYCGR